MCVSVSVCTYMGVYVPVCVWQEGDYALGSMLLAEYGQKRQHTERTLSRKDNCLFE